MINMEGVIGDNTLASKCIVYEQPEKGMYFPMVLTAFDGDDHTGFDRAGYRGRYVFFTVIEGTIQESVDDPHDLEMEMADEEVKEFMHQVFQGWRTEGHRGINWSNIEDGETYTEDDFPSMYE